MASSAASISATRSVALASASASTRSHGQSARSAWMTALVASVSPPPSGSGRPSRIAASRSAHVAAPRPEMSLDVLGRPLAIGRSAYRRSAVAERLEHRYRSVARAARSRSRTEAVAVGIIGSGRRLRARSDPGRLRVRDGRRQRGEQRIGPGPGRAVVLADGAVARRLDPQRQPEDLDEADRRRRGRTRRPRRRWPGSCRTATAASAARRRPPSRDPAGPGPRPRRPAATTRRTPAGRATAR